MILNKETYEKYKYDANSISKFSTKVLIVQCDNCKNIFEKESNKIFMARKNSSSEFDVCKEKKCIVSKREMTMEKKYGNKYFSVDSEEKNNILQKFFEEFKQNNREGDLITDEDIIKAKNNGEKIYATIIEEIPKNDPDKPLEIKEKQNPQLGPQTVYLKKKGLAAWRDG